MCICLHAQRKCVIMRWCIRTRVFWIQRTFCCSVRGSVETIKRLKELCRKAGKKTYTFVMGKVRIICVCVCPYIHISIHTCINISTYIYVYVCTYLFVYVMHMHLCIHVHMLATSCSRCMTMCDVQLNVPKLANFMEIDVYVLVACPENSMVRNTCVCIVYLYVCVCSIQIYIYMYMHVYVCVYVYWYVFVCI